MYECRSCFKKFPRSLIFLHMTKCKPKNYEEISDSPSDDSDKDPLWLPSPIDQLSESRAASPVTDEQADVANKAGQMLIDISESSQPSKNGVVKLRLEKLQELKQKIKEWENRKKEALVMGKKSKARRLAKNLNKMLKLVVDVDSEDLNPTPQHLTLTQDQNIQQEKVEKKQITKSVPRKKNYCIYCKTFVVKFSVHVENKHQDTPEGKCLIELNKKENDIKKRRLLKIKATSIIRNKWNSIYNKSVPVTDVIRVKRRKGEAGEKKNPDVTCKHCYGIYRRDKLYVHLNKCEVHLSNKPSATREVETSTSQIQAIKNHSVPILNEAITNNITQVFVDEILQGISGDQVMDVAIKDELIMHFGSNFHKSHREPSSKGFVKREMKDLARLLIEMKKRNSDIKTMKDCLNPGNFHTMIDSTLSLANYEERTGEVGVPSIAYRLTQPLKDCANLLKAKELNKGYDNQDPGRKLIMMVDDFLSMINSQWKIHVGRICTKAQKRRKADKKEIMALDDDIVKVSLYIEGKYRETMRELEKEPDGKKYDLLTHMVVSHIMLLIRRRPVDFKHAKLRHFHNIDKDDGVITMANGYELTKEEIDRCKKFHLFYAPGKNLELVPIVLTPLMKSVLDTLIRYRNSVNITCDTLFIRADGKLINPNESLKLIVRRVANLKKPDHLTGNGLRHQAATFSKFHSSHPLYQDYLASALGHTLAVHKKHYDLPQGVLHKLLVCPILHDIMTGKNKKKGNDEEGKKPLKKLKSLETEINNDQDQTAMEEPVEITDKLLETPKKNLPVALTPLSHAESSELSSEEEIKIIKPKKRWSNLEQEVVLSHFGSAILNKTVPTRGEVVEFLKAKKELLDSRSVSQVLLFVRNHALRKQLNVSPKVRKILKNCIK